MKYVEVTWHDPATDPPPERETVIGYTEEGNIRDVTIRNGSFDTYCQVLRWCYAPKPPVFDKNDKPKKTRKKKST